MGPGVADVDGVVEDRRGIQFVFIGQNPEVVTFDTIEDEAEGVAAWLTNRLNRVCAHTK